MGDELPNDADGDVLRRLIVTGSDLSKEMEIDFTVDVPNKEYGTAFVQVVEPLGFRTNVDQDSETGDWTCYCTRRMIPSYRAIIEVQKTLEDLGRPFNAIPEVWGSFGNADAK